jgi:hypothetical protein
VVVIVAPPPPPPEDALVPPPDDVVVDPRPPPEDALVPPPDDVVVDPRPPLVVETGAVTFVGLWWAPYPKRSRRLASEIESLAFCVGLAIEGSARTWDADASMAIIVTSMEVVSPSVSNF